MKKPFLAFYFGLAVIPIFFSCTNENDLTIGNQFIRSNTRLVCIDTLTVKLSTFKMDSLETSGNNLALVGRFNDSNIGTISSSSYIVMGNNALTLQERIVLDSFVLILKPSGYYYGDTLSSYKIQVHEVAKRIEPKEDASVLYNTDTIECKPILLGEKVVSPKPALKKEIRIPINSTISTELFDKFRSSTKPFTDDNPFTEYFKGIRLSTTEANSILGFTVSDTSILMTMYYHASDNIDSTGTLTIKPSNTTYQFNSVSPAEAGSVIMSITEDPVSSEDLNNLAFLQGGSGIFTRVEFPSLKNIVTNYDKPYEILRADLIIQPSAKMDFNYLPSKLNIYSTNKHNDFLSAITDASGSQVTSTLVKNEEYKEESYYTWDITYYIKQLINAGDWEYNGIHIIPVDYASKFDHVIIADQKASKYKTQLKIYILYYE
ncbi:hypothetical protein CYCD_14360 [Tenuifilaceae bacterium CYCD]|nr:hypothetical protein CYCD_14360 [Tenuifilaceae bacterium CYCD]